MKHAIVISPRVVERLRFMDADERHLIFDTLVHDEILCDTRTAQLTPSFRIIFVATMLLTIINVGKYLR